MHGQLADKIRLMTRLEIMQVAVYSLAIVQTQGQICAL